MKVMSLAIPDVLLFEPRVFSDTRGCFFESFRSDLFNELSGLNKHFVQDNRSFSYKGVLRGLHYQLDPCAQGKLVQVLRGEIFDVAVDLRKSSPSFGKWVAEVLSAENRKQLWVPEGFAHGFLALTDSECMYKVTEYYSPDFARSIYWNDSELDIEWPLLETPTLSLQDGSAQEFLSAEFFG